MQPPQRTPTLPLVLMLLALVGSIALPWAIEGRLTQLWSDISDIADPARTLVSDIQAAVGLEMAGVRGYLISGDRAYAGIFADAQARRRRAYAQLLAMTDRLDAGAAQLTTRLGASLDSADRPVGALFRHQVTAAEFVRDLPAQQARFEQAMQIAVAIDRQLRTTIAVRRTEIRRAEWVRLVVIYVMTLIAFGAALSVVSLGRQYRRAYAAERAARADADRARQELERQHAEVERVTASRAALIRGFTHDVKNPIGVASGDLQMLDRGVAGPLNDKQRASVARASRALTTALALIQDLLALARAEIVEVKQSETDVCALVKEIVDEHQAAANAKSLNIAFEGGGDAPPIVTDPVRVRQVIGNLLSNAVKYTSRGRIAVRVRFPAPRRNDREWIAIDVADTGPGISEAQKALVFQEFQRLSSAEGTSGSGIGLAISRRLALALNGDVTVESTEGRGSVFTLWLPAGVPGSPGQRQRR